LQNHITLDRRHDGSTPQTALRQSPAARDARYFEFALMRTVIAASNIAASTAASASSIAAAAAAASHIGEFGLRVWLFAAPFFAATTTTATAAAATATAATATATFLVWSER
jgi:hypothetical protein